MLTRPSRRAGAVAVATALWLTGATISPLQAQSQSGDGATFTCDPGFYQVISGQLAELDPVNNSYTPLGPDQPSYNAMGYRIADGYLYGIRDQQLLRIDSTGAVTVVHQLDLPAGPYTGDFADDGLLHVSRGGQDWHTVDVETGQTTPRPEISGDYAVADIANVHGVFYGMATNGSLYRIDPTSNVVENLGVASGLPAGSAPFGAAWSTAGGNLYVGRNSGEIFQVTGYSTNSPEATQVATAPATNSNDGSSCSLARTPPGIADVDGPEPETPPSTPEAEAAAQRYSEEGPATYTFPSSGIPDGPSCATGVDEDRPERLSFSSEGVTSPTLVYASAEAASLTDFDILSGLWTEGTATLDQTHDCGYDYSALLRTAPLLHYRWEATVGGANGVNQGGLLINQSSPVTRSGATIIDLADGGDVLRWGFYDESGYYEAIGSVPITLGSSGAVDLAIEVHGNEVQVLADGLLITSFTTVQSGGHVGLVASRAAATFGDMTLTALPENGASS